MTYAPKATVAKARSLRRKMTLPEVLVWNAIRGRRMDDVRFRRQHPLGPYILDFYCEDARLAVEIDGQGHEHPDAAAHDERRTEWLHRNDVAVMRIAARDVLEDLEDVLQRIRRRVRG
ncbi:MAG TPA: endonuclease domain-containing protein [Brevundimonas sp.]|uniref:endonuclease domain-containing protein n=1 Tax=Brevundimonas sp. TaxID=1871086 RepID=UPI00260667C1|nr:endonuclease domain-containing protein [Brevundimonas sp.]HRO33482.1 endonuclease domain-containing protein [Brevundimonas sp.]